MSRVYDLLLVYTSFRRHDPYLNVALRLGRRLRIGIVKLDIDTSKVERAESRFLSECLQAGCDLVEGPARGRVLLIPRMGIKSIDKLSARIAAGVAYDKAVILVNGPLTGVPFIEELHRRFAVKTLLTQDLSRFGEFEPEAKEFARAHGLEVLEVGSPYAAHPALPAFSTDYLVSYPSHNSLPDRTMTYPLLDRLMRTLDELPKDAVVMVKPHNVKDVGNYLSYRSETLTRLGLPRLLLKAPLAAFRSVAYVRIGGRPLYARLSRRAADALRHLQNEYIFTGCENVLDRFPGYGMEHFVSGVRKGVITGLSSVLWEVLFQRKPVLNIDELPLAGRLENFQQLARSYKTQEYRGFSSAGFGVIAESCRAADFFGVLERQCRPEVTA